MLAAGWQHFEHPQPDVQTSVELSPVAPYADRFSLLMHAALTTPQKNQPLIESPPLWVASGPVGLAPGDVICIRGQVRILAPIRGAVDGLMIVDSLGGEPLAQRFGQTDGWREFVMYRSANQPTTINLAFVLTGLGDAWIDDVSIRIIRRGNISQPVSTLNFPARSPAPVFSPSNSNVLWTAPAGSVSPLPALPQNRRTAGGPMMVGQSPYAIPAAR